MSAALAAAERARRWIWVHGVVQGVGYRAATRAEAARLGLVGAVSNRVDGSVEVCAEGPPEALDALLSWCRRGPPGAEVERIETRTATPTGAFTRFDILRR